MKPTSYVAIFSIADLIFIVSHTLFLHMFPPTYFAISWNLLGLTVSFFKIFAFLRLSLSAVCIHWMRRLLCKNFNFSFQQFSRKYSACLLGKAVLDVVVVLHHPPIFSWLMTFMRPFSCWYVNSIDK